MQVTRGQPRTWPQLSARRFAIQRVVRSQVALVVASGHKDDGVSKVVLGVEGFPYLNAVQPEVIIGLRLHQGRKWSLENYRWLRAAGQRKQGRGVTGARLVQRLMHVWVLVPCPVYEKN